MHRTDISSTGLPQEVVDAWARVWAADPSATVFHHPDWSIAGAPDLRDRAAVLWNESSVLAVRIDDDGVLRFLSDSGVTDFSAPVSAGDRDAASANLIEALAALEWRTADLDGLTVDSGWAEPLARHAKAAGWSVEVVDVTVSPAIPLEGDFESYLAAIETKQRHEIRRKGRRLERELAPWQTRLADAASLAADMDAFVSFHREADGDKGGFMTPAREALFRRVAQMALERGWLRLTWLETLDGTRLASVFSFMVRGRWLVWNSAFDPANRHLSVGMVAMAEQIRLACEEECSVFDLLRGDEEYKYRLGAQDVPVTVLRIDRGDR